MSTVGLAGPPTPEAQPALGRPATLPPANPAPARGGGSGGSSFSSAPAAESVASASANASSSASSSADTVEIAGSPADSSSQRFTGDGTAFSEAVSDGTGFACSFRSLPNWAKVDFAAM